MHEKSADCTNRNKHNFQSHLKNRDVLQRASIALVLQSDAMLRLCDLLPSNETMFTYMGEADFFSRQVARIAGPQYLCYRNTAVNTGKR